MKIDLTNLNLEDRVKLANRYWKRKIRQAETCGGHEDPYIDTDDLKRKFKIMTDDRDRQFEELFTAL
jgi:hypothetical protein